MARKRRIRCVPRAQTGDAGVTLVELLMTVAIMGIAFVAIIGGFYTITTVSSGNRDLVDGRSTVKQYAELIESQPFRTCPATYSLAGVVTPTGWNAPTVTLTYWDPVATSTDPVNTKGAFVAGCPSATAVQRIHITMTTSDGRTSVVFESVKRPW